jgi:hypothetical protein
MEVEQLIYALQETISYLRASKPTESSHMSIDEIIRRLEAELTKARNAKPMDVILLDRLFAPTGVIQAISIANGWGTKFLRISQVVDQLTVN